jgi:hypothetical protein
MMDTQLLVVPKSMPIILPIMFSVYGYCEAAMCRWAVLKILMHMMCIAVFALRPPDLTASRYAVVSIKLSDE